MRTWAVLAAAAAARQQLLALGARRDRAHAVAAAVRGWHQRRGAASGAATLAGHRVDGLGRGAGLAAPALARDGVAHLVGRAAAAAGQGAGALARAFRTPAGLDLHTGQVKGERESESESSTRGTSAGGFDHNNHQSTQRWPSHAQHLVRRALGAVLAAAPAQRHVLAVGAQRAVREVDRPARAEAVARPGVGHQGVVALVPVPMRGDQHIKRGEEGVRQGTDDGE